jgi:hypothetical protein
VYDILGREVSVLVNERRDAGAYEAELDGSNLASRVCFYQLRVLPDPLATLEENFHHGSVTCGVCL